MRIKLVTTPQTTTPIKTIFVTSCGYTGTHWMSQAARALMMNTLSVHEPYPIVAELGNTFYRKEIKPDRAIQIFENARKPLVEMARVKFRKSCYLEANQDLALLIPVIKECFREGIVIGMVRNGRDFTESAMTRSMYAYEKPWWLCPVRSKVPKWNKWSRVMKLSWYWGAKTTEVVRNSHMIIRFEELFDPDYCKGYEVFKGIMDFLRIPWDRDITRFMSIHQRKYNSSGVILNTMKWTEEENNVFRKYCGPMMKELGYDY